MRQIVQFIRAGGMDRTRAIEKEDLHRQQLATETEARIAGSGSLVDNPMARHISIGHPDNVDLAVDLIGGLASILFNHRR
jgi:hypothetical protein